VDAGLADFQQYAALDRQVRDLEKQQKKAAGSAQNWDSYEFRISPTCPPSTSIWFRSGSAWWNSNALFSRRHTVPSYRVDLADPDKASVRPGYNAYTTTFTQPHWYVSYVVVLSNYGLDGRETWPETVPNNAIYLISGYGSPYYNEVETAAEAEYNLYTEVNMQVCDYNGIAVGGVVLRNNGNTGQPNEYMPIDRINRGRSYLWWMIGNTWELG